MKIELTRNTSEYWQYIYYPDKKKANYGVIRIDKKTRTATQTQRPIDPSKDGLYYGQACVLLERYLRDQRIPKKLTMDI